ncbi:lactyl (2) diphospho-(5')guanosine:7,8-didemethyl-8-hydroxy-5-deazariboflavin 2-phospho-L-lactate transferase [Halarchaeum acidiphilum MH1-52-1]|uniref:2-phospho-L-lactate transferase n=1 Tax=Halarchaeum acidiphilum MH1-52-1 TaxID=1261545 RepID=U3ADS4_9EURY|nr:2-phospho-L-lactate transferase CofD family protein [Halarchaeum acidiphilum]GAD52918.1 lactyl (2) diphospho-(5')guanosine:7,8-didemethyl-8-hydroxy-5-deazariboflavin 2-phospho-L-lactate transferase [Halarchaeum acidiphilum MH1-52-1]
MPTFLSGGTGTPKLLAGARDVFDPAETTVVANTGDDVEIGGFLVSPDLDTVLFDRGGVLDREFWWGIEGDTHETHDELERLADRAGLDAGPRYLDAEAQTSGRDIARWRRFSAAREFMTIGDRDRAVHLLRTSLLDEGRTLTEVTRTLADAFDLDITLLPMSDDPVATLIHAAEGSDGAERASGETASHASEQSDGAERASGEAASHAAAQSDGAERASGEAASHAAEGTMHFQEFWVGRRADVAIEGVEFRGAVDAEPTDAVREALCEPVIVGPSNPVTSLGPLLALDGVREALRETTVVAVSPFVEDEVFSGPADDLMRATGREPSTAGVAEAYDFADAFVLDSADSTALDRPVVRTDTRMDDDADAARVARACANALEAVDG